MKILPFLPLLLLTACGVGTVTTTTAPVPLDPAIETVLRHPLPEGAALPIPEARKEQKAGDAVLLEGRIMGVVKPFVEGRAAFVLGDNATITPCSDMEDDHCAEPWDACCDPNEVRMAGTATIQIVDESGAVIRQGLEGVHGLEKLASVKVAGVLAPTSTEAAMIVNATAIRVGE